MVSKCGDIGALKKMFLTSPNAEKAQILSHQSKPKQTEETVDAELVEPGAIELHTSAGSAAAPLMKFDIQAIELNVPGSDLSALQQQTAQLESVVNQGANAVAYALASRFHPGVAAALLPSKTICYKGFTTHKRFSGPAKSQIMGGHGKYSSETSFSRAMMLLDHRSESPLYIGYRLYIAIFVTALFHFQVTTQLTNQGLLNHAYDN